MSDFVYGSGDNVRPARPDEFRNSEMTGKRLKVASDCMSGAGILRGDHIFVDPDAPIRSGDIVVVKIERVLLRRIFFEAHGVVLKAENPEFRTINGIPSDQVLMIGRVVGIERRLS